MPALVVRIEVKVGDEVKEGKGLVILEAMKMENELRAHQSGRVKQIFVEEGKPVEKGQLLLLME
jgi:biotin carboxyl carrier protein